MSAFLVSFFVILVAELGDKSQLVALWFATRFRWWVVLSGVTVATLVVHLASVAVGRAFDEVLPERILLAVVGVSFFVFAAWSIRGDRLDSETAQCQAPVLGAFGVVTVSFFLSELGDKTQFATIVLAGDQEDLVGVWFGSTFGMVAADALAIGAGLILGRNLPQRFISIGAAALFCIFGMLALLRALTG